MSEKINVLTVNKDKMLTILRFKYKNSTNVNALNDF
jgi:hypothetical protein